MDNIPIYVKLAEHIGKMEKYAKKISTRPIGHNSIPVWRARALSSALPVSIQMDMLSENQLTLSIELIGKFIDSFSNTTTGYYDHWLNMRAELVEQLELIQEEEDVSVSDIMDKKFWLISISGNDWCFDQLNETISITIELPDGETPIDWYTSKPEVPGRFGFTIHALLNFWEITQEQFKALKK